MQTAKNCRIQTSRSCHAVVQFDLASEDSKYAAMFCFERNFLHWICQLKSLGGLPFNCVKQLGAADLPSMCAEGSATKSCHRKLFGNHKIHARTFVTPRVNFPTAARLRRRYQPSLPPAGSQTRRWDYGCGSCKLQPEKTDALRLIVTHTYNRYPGIKKP